MSCLLEKGLEGSGISLGEEACRQLNLFLSELLRWNQKVNLTSVVNHDEAVEKHLLDSVLLLPFLGEGMSLLDMGSGAGLPGIPLSLARRDLSVVSVDSVGKKIRFQRHIKRLLSLENFFPCNSRLEDLAGELLPLQRFDLVTARAFSSLGEIVRLAAPWLGAGGRILAMKGPEGETEVVAVKEDLAEYGVEVDVIHGYRLPFSGAERQLIVLVRV